MSSAPIVDRIRIIPRPDDFLNRNVGSSGEVFFNRETSSLRVYSGKDVSGFEIARADLDNVADADLEARITALGISGSGGASVDVSETAPTEPSAGNLWLNTTNGRLYIYINDGDTSQWMQPAVPSFSGSYNDLSDKPTFSIDDLLDVDTTTAAPEIGEVLKWDGTKWAPGTDVAEGGAGLDADTLDGEQGTHYLDYDNFTNTPTTLAGYGITDSATSAQGALADSAVQPADLTSYAQLAGSTFTGLVTLQQTTEKLNALTGATGVVEHDLDNGAVFNHTSLAANFTANFTNVPTTADRTISIVLILNQGGTAYIPTAVQIDNTAQTINWQGATTPSGNTNQVDIVSFTLIRVGASWTVIGSLTTYG